MKQVLILLLFLFVGANLHSQVVVVHKPKITMYTTYEDYANNTGKEYEFVGPMGVNRLKIMVNGESKNVQVKQYWGWKFKDVLFRVHQPTNSYGAVVKAGNFIYYEYGYGWIRALINGSGWFECSEGGLSQYVSESLQSDMYPMVVKDLKTFKTNYPSCSGLADQLIALYSHFTPNNCFKETIRIVDEFMGGSNTMALPNIKYNGVPSW